VLVAVSLLHKATTGAEIFASCSGWYGQGPSLDRFCWKYRSMAGMLPPHRSKKSPSKAANSASVRTKGAKAGAASARRPSAAAAPVRSMAAPKVGQVVFFRHGRDVAPKEGHGAANPVGGIHCPGSAVRALGAPCPARHRLGDAPRRPD
jgi:hypothetical protein